MKSTWSLPGMLVIVALLSTAAGAEEPRAAVSERFAPESVEEQPDFRRHVIPLAGRLGCNGRACHGSFQGQGGFRLSLFGYDFEADHEAMAQGDSPRVNLEQPAESLILQKPTMGIEHEGGERMKTNSWAYHLLSNWIKAGAKGDVDYEVKFAGLEITPSELIFDKPGSTKQLKVVAVWSDGSREDVTPLCRFQTNDETVATINEDGLVTSAGTGDTHVVTFYDNGVQPIPVLLPVSDQVGPKYPQVPTPTEIDRLVVQKLRKLGVVPSELADDAMFLRRVSLDITGTLPAPAEVEAFLADNSPKKRSNKIDELLERPAYAAWWTTRLCDITGNNDDNLNNATLIRGEASQQWYDWIYKRVENNTPYDELAANIVLATSREEGESFIDYSRSMSSLYHEESESTFADRSMLPYYWARQNFRDPEDRAIGFAYAFMGLRIQCAQCHKHPFDQWTKQDFAAFTGFFTSVVSGNDPATRDDVQKLAEAAGVSGTKGNEFRKAAQSLLKEGKVVPFPEVYVAAQRTNRRKAQSNNSTSSVARVLGGEEVDLSKFSDARQPLMEWLRSADNPYFARSFVNRVWSNYFNRGIVEPADDLSLANPPSNKPLLDYLTEGFINSDFDMKWLHREIANSRTYQLSWVPNPTNRLDEVNFSRAVPRRLAAEVAVDALSQATASDDAIAKLQEDLTGRSIMVPGAGRRRNATSYSLQIFGRSVRDTNCDCDRSAEPSLLQTVFLQNDSDVNSMLVRRDGWVRQVATARGALPPKDVAVANSNGKPSGLERVVINVTRRLKEAKASNNKKQIVQLERQLDRSLKAVEKANGDKPKPVAEVEAPRPSGTPLAVESPEKLVRSAYLRTLSRLPSEEETKRSIAFLTQADDLSSGAQGLLWALINTKEFIVNH